MSAECKSRLQELNQRAHRLGFGSIVNLGYWIHLGVNEKTLVRWNTSKKDPKPRLLDIIEELLFQIESDPRHYMRNFVRKRRSRKERCAS